MLLDKEQLCQDIALNRSIYDDTDYENSELTNSQLAEVLSCKSMYDSVDYDMIDNVFIVSH